MRAMITCCTAMTGCLLKSYESQKIPSSQRFIYHGSHKALPRRSRSRHSIMHILEIHNLALKNTKVADVVETLQSHKDSREQDITWVPQRNNKLRNDRGALPRGRAVPNAQARTRIHAIRHGRI